MKGPLRVISGKSPLASFSPQDTLFLDKVNSETRAPQRGKRMSKAAVDAEKASAGYVLTTFQAARKAGLSVVESYRTGIVAYLRNHRDQRPYAAERAAAIILAYRWSALLRQYRSEWDRGAPEGEARQRARRIRRRHPEARE